MIPTDIRAAFLRNGWKRFTCEVDVPPFAVMRVVSTTNTNGEIVYTTAQPDTTFRRFYMVNGPFYIAASTSAAPTEGLCTTLADAGYVQYNSANTPAVGEVWGPKSGQWSLEKYYYGFEIQGGTKTTAGVAVVVAAQHRVDSVRAKTNGAHARAASQAVHLYDSNGTDTTIDIADVLNSYVDLEDDVTCDVLWQGSQGVLVAGDCTGA